MHAGFYNCYRHACNPYSQWRSMSFSIYAMKFSQNNGLIEAVYAEVKKIY